MQANDIVLGLGSQAITDHTREPMQIETALVANRPSLGVPRGRAPIYFNG